MIGGLEGFGFDDDFECVEVECVVVETLVVFSPDIEDEEVVLLPSEPRDPG